MKTNGVVFYILVIIASVAFLFIGNRIASTTFEDTGYAFEMDFYNGVVIEIIERVEDEGWGPGTASTNIIFDVQISRGERRGEVVSVQQQISEFFLVNEREVSLRDRIIIVYDGWNSIYYFAYFNRINYVMVLGAVFFALILLFGRKKGFNSLISLGFTVIAVFWVFVPAILSGRNIYLTTVVICIYAIVSTLLIVIGPGKKAVSAMLGCLGGIFAAGSLMLLMDRILQLTGGGDRDTEVLLLLPTETPISLRAIVFAGVILGAVGAIMDVAMSIASSLWEVKEAGGEYDFNSLFKSGVTIGKDILGTMLNTLILAYIGSSLSLILLITVNTHSLAALFNMEMIIVEFLRALIGSFGMLLTIPLTSAICGWLYDE
ncbi:MAG: YibE/F family protein [Defluviitaleaceae bacterium]|nr:YibE/F family protein [Defluviitaleaceae bacterium]